MAFTLDLIKPGDGEATRYRLDDAAAARPAPCSCPNWRFRSATPC